MRNLYQIAGPDGSLYTGWADSRTEAEQRAKELKVLNQIIREEAPARDPEGSMWFRGALVAIALLFAWTWVAEELPAADQVHVAAVTR